MYKVYILKSEKFGRYYIGHTKDLENRIERHNQGKVRSTKAYRFWNLVYSENFENKKEACKREMEIKSFKSGLAFKSLLKK